MDSWVIEIARGDLNDAKIVEAGPPTPGEGQLLVAIDEYAMTANNITYGVFGEPAGLFGPDEDGGGQGYWDFFSERGEPGRLPIWGFATVVESRADGIAAGERFYGYYPMASHAVLTASNIRETGFVDVTPRRTTLPPIYNNYQKLDRIVDYRSEHHDYWPVFRPLFLTGWLIADQYADEGDYGAEQIVIASASSKTAIGLAFAHRQRGEERPRSIGLTSPSHVESLAATGIYHTVIAYEDIGSLDASKPTGYVDMAGNGAVTAAVHRHFGDNLRNSMIVGKSHWDSPRVEAGLPGAPPTGFFAPARSEKRLADWGPAEFGQRVASAWLGFMEVAPGIAAIDRRSGPEAALAAYREMLSGKADPKSGIVVAP